MTQINKLYIYISAILGFLAVALGAYGSHKVKGQSDVVLYDRFELANRYHFYFTFAILILSLYEPQENKKLYYTVPTFFLLGIFLFSGSLYLQSMFGFYSFKQITPYGGMSFLLGWFLLLVWARLK
jgi:uncharacterized membrane protein YgdD (TMEM256/DUF423 family)